MKVLSKLKEPLSILGFVFVASLWIIATNAEALGSLAYATAGILFGMFISLFPAALKAWERNQMRKQGYVEVRALEELYRVVREANNTSAPTKRCEENIR